jgi:hypothetical protein
MVFFSGVMPASASDSTSGKVATCSKGFDDPGVHCRNFFQ